MNHILADSPDGTMVFDARILLIADKQAAMPAERSNFFCKRSNRNVAFLSLTPCLSGVF
jgi:hypothetical protein